MAHEAVGICFQKNRAVFLIKFIDTDGTVIDVINGAAGADTLRQRYQSAEKARHDAESYPVLHTKAKHLLKTLPGTYEKVQAFKSEQTRLQMTGKWPL